jgi:hypothetical protein
MDIGNHIFYRIENDDPLAVRLFNHKGQTGHMGYHGIYAGCFFDGKRAILVQNKNILAMNLIHKSQMPCSHGVLDDL